MSFCREGLLMLLMSVMTSARDVVDCVRWVRMPDNPKAAMLVNKGEGCNFRRFQPHEARELLRDEYVLYVGDSVVAYEYLSLASFLFLGDNLTAWDDGRWGHPHPLAEPLWKNGSNTWNEYYRKTNEMFAGKEICDCFRDAKCHPRCIPQTFFANRHFRMPSASNQARPTVSFLFAGGQVIKPQWHNIISGVDDFSCKNKHMCPRRPPDHKTTKLGYQHILQLLGKHFEPTILMAGIHNHWAMKPDSKGKIAKELGTACNFARHWKRPVTTWLSMWRSNPPSKGTFTKLSSGDEGVKVAKCNLAVGSGTVFMHLEKLIGLLSDEHLGMDIRDVFVDNLHFRPWVYFEITQTFLNSVHIMKETG